LKRVTKVPFLSIPALVANLIKKRKFKRIGLLATPNTLKSTLYDEAIGNSAVIVRPSRKLSEKTESLIFKQLNGTITIKEKENFRTMVDNFLEANNLDSVILGCTELPLIFGDSKDDRIIDTLEVLSEGLLSSIFNQ